MQIRAGSSARDEPLSESEKERLEDFQCELLEVGTKARNKVLRLNRLESKVSELGVTAERAVKRGDETSARQALKEKASLKIEVERTKEEIDNLKALAAKLEDAVNSLEARKL